jgi:CheY-like chemotaxis protein
MLDSNLDKALCPVAPEGGRMGSPEAGPAAPRKRGILVVDDDADVRFVLGVALRQEGYATWLAANGLEALDLYWRNSRTIDLVLLDVRMPGLDGPQTLAALRDLNPRIHCCFLTGDFGGYSGGELGDLGAAVLLKPFRLAEIARAVRQLAGMAEEGSSLAWT